MSTRINGFTTLSSDYCTSLEQDAKPKYKIDDDKFREEWKSEFLELADDFCISRKIANKIIRFVVDTSKPQDKGENLYIRAMNKMYDLI